MTSVQIKKEEADVDNKKLIETEDEIILKTNPPEWRFNYRVVREAISSKGEPFEDRDYGEPCFGYGRTVGRHYNNADGTQWSYFPDGTAYFQGHAYNMYAIRAGKGWKENRVTGEQALLPANDRMFYFLWSHINLK